MLYNYTTSSCCYICYFLKIPSYIKYLRPRDQCNQVGRVPVSSIWAGLMIPSICILKRLASLLNDDDDKYCFFLLLVTWAIFRIIFKGPIPDSSQFTLPITNRSLNHFLGIVFWFYLRLGWVPLTSSKHTWCHTNHHVGLLASRNPSEKWINDRAITWLLIRQSNHHHYGIMISTLL